MQNTNIRGIVTKSTDDDVKCSNVYGLNIREVIRANILFKCNNMTQMFIYI
jgi:hypothetical protein